MIGPWRVVPHGERSFEVRHVDRLDLKGRRFRRSGEGNSSLRAMMHATERNLAWVDENMNAAKQRTLIAQEIALMPDGTRNRYLLEFVDAPHFAAVEGVKRSLLREIIHQVNERETPRA